MKSKRFNSNEAYFDFINKYKDGIDVVLVDIKGDYIILKYKEK